MGDWWSEEIVQRAVVNQKLTEGVEHPAPFPEKIVILPVLQTTNEGDLVLDPFCGSMTTGKVSERFNRQFVGYDVQVYWDLLIRVNMKKFLSEYPELIKE